MHQETRRESLLQEATQLNLMRHTSEVVSSIAQSKLSIKDQDIIIEICVLMHQRYADFAPKLTEALEKLYDGEHDFTKKRNILRLMSELYLKGLISEFKKIFRCLNQMTQVGCALTPGEPPTNLEDYQNGLMVLTDYLKTYGEIFFHILPRQRREAIESDYEVAIERHPFLSANQR